MMKVCHICNMNSGKHLLGCWSAEHIKDVEQQLAAANARVVELETQKPSYKAEFDCVYEKLKAEESLSEHYKQKAEQAEAQCAYWENKYKELINGR